jgi:hypothetical protein
MSYLPRGMALIESLRDQGDLSEISVLCLDDETFEFLTLQASNLNLALVTLAELVSEYPQLEDAKRDRSLIEFYFTCSPFVIKHSQRSKPKYHLSIYLDADLYFFGSPLDVIREVGAFSVAIIEHKYPWPLRILERKYGTYNVGLLAFRNDTDGNTTLDWWAEQCLNWCHDYSEDGKYADQGYLNQFPAISRNLKVLTNKGFNLAPWNTLSNPLEVVNSELWIGLDKLNFFHFHNLKEIGNYWISSQVNYLSPLSRKVFSTIYNPYIERLERIKQKLRQGTILAKPENRRRPGLLGLTATIARFVFMAISLTLGQAVPKLNQRGSR